MPSHQSTWNLTQVWTIFLLKGPGAVKFHVNWQSPGICRNRPPGLRNTNLAQVVDNPHFLQNLPPPFFPVIRLSRKPPETREKQLVLEKNDGWKEWKRTQPLEIQEMAPSSSREVRISGTVCFSVVYFSRGTESPNQKRNRLRRAPGDRVTQTPDSRLRPPFRRARGTAAPSLPRATGRRRRPDSSAGSGCVLCSSRGTNWKTIILGPRVRVELVQSERTRFSLNSLL